MSGNRRNVEPRREDKFYIAHFPRPGTDPSGAGKGAWMLTNSCGIMDAEGLGQGPDGKCHQAVMKAKKADSRLVEPEPDEGMFWCSFGRVYPVRGRNTGPRVVD